VSIRMILQINVQIYRRHTVKIQTLQLPQLDLKKSAMIIWQFQMTVTCVYNFQFKI